MVLNKFLNVKNLFYVFRFINSKITTKRNLRSLLTKNKKLKIRRMIIKVYVCLMPNRIKIQAIK
jgi:hypothetical protein